MEQSRDELITENMNLVYSALHKYYPSMAYDEDMIQYGMIGLIKAADTYDASKSKFSTYAMWVILNEIKQEFRRRHKPYEVVSLSQEIGVGDDKITLEDSLCGEEDIEFVDVSALTDGLTDEERKILDWTTEGLTQLEIAKKMGCSQPQIGRILRRIKLKWSNVL